MYYLFWLYYYWPIWAPSTPLVLLVLGYLDVTDERNRPQYDTVEQITEPSEGL